MTENQLREQLHATGESIARSTVPLGDIRVAGRTIARRRTAVRLVIGGATAAAAVSAVALLVPTGAPSTDGAPPLTSPETLQPCPTGLVRSGPPGRTRCLDAFPEPDAADPPPQGGLAPASAAELAGSGPEQRTALEDGRVTGAEYRAGFDRYRTCLAERGHTLRAVLDTGLQITYAVGDDAVSSGDDKVCYERHWQVLDMAWQEIYAYPIFVRDTLTHANLCLVRAGAEAAPDLEQAAQLLEDAGLSEEDCMLLPGQIEAASG